MSSGSQNIVTEMLHAVARGEAAARERLWNAVYDELRRAARMQLRDERHRVTVQTTMLVHEAYLRLVGDGAVDWSSRRHFFGAAALAMRRILVDSARERRALKRGEGRRRIPLDAAEDATGGVDNDAADLLALDEALKKLEAEAPRAAEVVHLRYFAGLSGDEAAELLGVSARTVDLDWKFARTWLFREMSRGA